MRGHAVGMAAMAASAVVLNRSERVSTSVIAFAADALVLQGLGERRAPAALVDDLLSLRGKGRTDLALALRTAARELAREPAAERLAIVLSDCRATAGDDPLRRSPVSIVLTCWEPTPIRRRFSPAVAWHPARAGASFPRPPLGNSKLVYLGSSPEGSVELSGRMVA